MPLPTNRAWWSPGSSRTPLSQEAYIPEAVGQKREILIGKKSGVMSLAKKLEERGLTLPKDALRELLGRVKAFAVAHKRTLTDEEFFALVKQ